MDLRDFLGEAGWAPALYLLCSLNILIGALGAWAVSRYGHFAHLLDCPNERSSHCTPTPKGGGIGIWAAFLLTSVILKIPAVFWLPIGALAAVALWGDRKDLSPRLRLCIQTSLSAVLVISGPPLPGSFFLDLPWIIFWTVFIVGTTNFYNFMDGINGIAGLTGAIGFALMAVYIYAGDSQSFLWLLATCVSLSCLGFLPLNMPTAKVFMGDVGSILLGSLFAGMVYLTSFTLADFICMASFLFPFYADELTTMFIRLRDGDNLTHAHRKHLYQILANEKGIPHWKVSAGCGFIQIIVGITVILTNMIGGLPQILTLLIIYFFTFSTASYFLRSTLPREPKD